MTTNELRRKIAAEQQKLETLMNEYRKEWGPPNGQYPMEYFRICATLDNLRKILDAIS